MRIRQIVAVALILMTLVVVLIAPSLTGAYAADDIPSLGRSLGMVSVLPPLLAVALAFLTKDVILSLLAGFASGIGLLASLEGDGLAATFTRGCSGILNTVSNRDNCAVILLCLIIGGMVEVIRQSGGFEAFAKALTKKVDSPRKANLVGELLGLIVFFDDYANALILGPVMRPVTDKLRISREKLSYLVDSTAAPVTGIAVVSSWVAVEVSVINEGFAAAGIGLSGYLTFLQSIPYCFYCIFCLVFILESSLMEREFGPMLEAEIRARGGQPLRPGSITEKDPFEGEPESGGRLRARIITAVFPIVLLCAAAFLSFLTDGRTAAVTAGSISPNAPFSLETLAIALGSADTIFLVLQASVLGSIAAVVLGCAFRLFSLTDAVQAWVKGASSLMVTAILLALAWSLADTVESLGTAYYVVDFITMNVPYWLVPTLIFLACCCISFAAGSYGCMFIVMPMAIPVAAAVISETGMQNDSAYLLACVAAVLSGGIFGDHCSPITDCTILSSMGSGCDNMDHVRTQTPYALTIAVVSVVCGTLPAGLGVSAWISLLVGFGALAAVVYVVGKNPDKEHLKKREVPYEQGERPYLCE